jgi:hypothetical protein
MYSELLYYYKHKNDPKYLKKRRDYYHKWYKKNGRKRNEKYKEYIEIWQSHHPKEFKAQQLLGRAIKAGKIIKPNQCSVCRRKNTRIHGHHKDYSKPLDVIWLCASCHKIYHSV